jgi:hypothetical protein
LGWDKRPWVLRPAGMDGRRKGCSFGMIVGQFLDNNFIMLSYFHASVVEL